MSVATGLARLGLPGSFALNCFCLKPAPDTNLAVLCKALDTAVRMLLCSTRCAYSWSPPHPTPPPTPHTHPRPLSVQVRLHAV